VEGFVKQIVARVFCVAALGLCGAAPALAQPSIDVAVGYQSLHAQSQAADVPDQSYPFGINVDLSVGLNDSIRVVGEYGLSRDTDAAFAVTGTLSASHVAGGIRYASDTPGWSPYVQFLVGMQHDSFSVDVASNNLFDFSDNTLMIQPGAGITFPITRTVGIFGQADYRRIFYEGQGETDYRFVVGVRIGR
jgi:hypothetical protein